MANIWVVDDDQDVSLILKFSLEKQGHKVEPFIDTDSALARLKEERPDLFILDVIVPEIGGYTFYSRLQEDESTRRTPVIIITGKKKMRDFFEGLPHVAGFLDKPLDLERVKALVDKAVPPRS